MNLDKLDIKIQEATDQYLPGYDEQAWNKMEKLLEEHLPQKKKDHRKLFWLFLLLFLLAGGLLLLNRQWSIHHVTVAEKINESATRDKTTNNLSPSSITPKNKTVSRQLSPSGNSSFTEENIAGTSLRNHKVNQRVTNDATGFKVNGGENNIKEENKLTNASPTDPAENIELKGKNQEENSAHNNQKVIIQSNKNDSSIKEDKENYITPKENNISTSKTKNKGPERKKKFSNSFAINISAGPDVSAVTIDNIGKMKVAYGAGISYSFAKKWTISTGFFVARKVYNAGPSDYHPSAGFWYNYPDLKTIEADCKVYDVPIIINYSFSQNSRHSWFGGVGISSYFMKREEYEYISKDPSGQSFYDSYSISNKNQHYLSSVRLSAAYERKFNNQVSIITEPYFNLPLTGIGFGKVKLYSSGILFTLSVKPFAKK